MKKLKSIDSFDRRFVIWNLLGYALATVPQIIIDPKLTTHVRFGQRFYPWCWVIIPLSIIVVIVSLVVITYAQKKSSAVRRTYFPLPFVIAIFVSLPVFHPEMPHGNLFFVFFVWIVISIATIFAHDFKIEKKGVIQSTIDKEARIEFLRQNTTLWRNLTFGLLAGFFAILVSVLTLMYKLNESIVNDSGEIFILKLYSGLLLSIFAIFYLVGLVYESFKNSREHVNLLLKIKREDTGNLGKK